MLGSVAEAEDVVQEALLRLHQADDVANPDAFLTTVTTRLAIDVLRSARVKREAYVGSWLPEPLVEDDAAGIVETDETVSLAFLVALERLTPDERAVLVLREAFDYGFDEIADVVGKDPANCRQILSRARRRVADDRRRFDPDPDEGRALALRFLEAAREGDMDRLVAMLAPDAVLVGDGGGKARSIGVPMVGAAAGRPRAGDLLPDGRGLGRDAATRRRERRSRLPLLRRRGPAGQRRRLRYPGRRHHPRALDAQSRQARPPRPHVGPRVASARPG